ncbi:hypothetical protein [Paraburkholderia sp.]|jgi:hypothetical protein|uniref:hypothetical protein n=1 Tax=Paraburkholderia sp. TaxID=1926495 RepID=UPI002F42B45E
MMDDWKVSNYTEPSNDNGVWMYYQNPTFPDLHMSRCVDTLTRDHMATNDRTYYYYGMTKPATFNTAHVPQHTQALLTSAWKDYFTVV